MSEALTAAGAAAGAVLAVLALLGLVWRRIARPAQEFFRDWRGESAREGVPERPGVMARLHRLEWQLENGDGTPLRQRVDEMNDQLAELRRPGSS